MTVDFQRNLVAKVTNQCQKLLDRIPSIAWLMTDRGEITAVNEQWYKYVERHNLTQPAQITEILHSEDLESFLLAWTEARELQESLEKKLRLKSISGDGEWFQIETEPDIDESGQTTWIGTATRLGGEPVFPSQHQSTQFLEALLDYASDGIVACDANGQLVLFNRAAQSFHGLPPEPIDPEEWANYYDLYDSDGVNILAKSEIPLFQALEEKTVIGQEMMIKAKQGKDRSLLASGSAIYSTTGEKLGAVALMRDITEQKRAMTALQQSEQKFKAIFDGVFQFIGLTKPDGILIEANMTALKFGGIQAEDAIGRLLWDVPGWSFAPTTQQLLKELTAKAATGEFVRCEVELTGAGNRLIIIDFSLMPIRNEHDEVIMLIPEGRDISQLRQAETDRSRAEYHSERLSTALKVAKAGAWIWNFSTQKIFWTREFEILFDYEPGSTQQIYSEWLERVHPDDRERSEAALQNTIDRKFPTYRCEYRVICRNGQIRWIDAIGELHHDEQGNPQISGLIYDITDRKQAEIALQASEELFRHTFEYTSMGFCNVVLDGTISRSNQKFCEIVGYTQAELAGTTFQEITEPADLVEDLALVEQLLNGDIDEYTLEKRYIHKQGHHVWVCLTVSLVREIAAPGKVGVPQYFIGAIQDITDRKKLELLNIKQTIDLQRLNKFLVFTQDSLKERNQELDSFVHIVSHDLKAPLRTISNLSTWIEEELDEHLAQENQRYFLLLRQRIHRMDALIDGLLRYSQVGRQALENEIVDVAELLSELIDSLSPPENFKIEFLSPLPTLTTKRILLSQVLANLLSNAIKHHDRADGLVEISVEDLGDRYRFSIADDGPGIPAGKDRERVFEIFRTLKPDSTGANTGIGLAVVKKIIEGEGGQIWLDDQLIKGTRFYFTWIHHSDLDS
jgi:PAS domain S-box-containing protein